MRTPQCLLVWLLFLLDIGVRPLSAQAQTQTQAQAASSVISCDVDPTCAQLAAEARQHSQSGHFDDAQQLYDSAYRRRPDPKLLYNLARILHKAGRPAQAIPYYRRYLDAGAEGNESQRSKAAHYLEEAMGQVQQAGPAPPVPVLPLTGNAPTGIQASSLPPQPPPTRETERTGTPLYRKWWLWTVVGVTAAGIAVGAGLGVAARRPDLTGAVDARPFGN